MIGGEEELECEISVEFWSLVTSGVVDGTVEQVGQPEGSGSGPGRLGGLNASATVQLPPSLVSKVRAASRRTGLSPESLVLDAVDFYLQERIYEWANLTPSGTAVAGRGCNSMINAELPEEMISEIEHAARQRSMSVDEVIYHAVRQHLDESNWQRINIERDAGDSRARPRHLR